MLIHAPLFIEDPQTPTALWYSDEIRQRLLSVLKRYHVTCVLGGHTHEDREANWHGITMVTSIGTANGYACPQECSFRVFRLFTDGWSVVRIPVESPG